LRVGISWLLIENITEINKFETSMMITQQALHIGILSKQFKIYENNYPVSVYISFISGKYTGEEYLSNSSSKTDPSFSNLVPKIRKLIVKKSEI